MNSMNTRQAADKTADLADRATAAVSDAKDYASDIAGDVAKTGRAAGEQVTAVAGNLKGALDKSITEQPMATLAVAAAAGFVIGALWKS